MLDLWVQTTEWFFMDLKIKKWKTNLDLLSVLMIKQGIEIVTFFSFLKSQSGVHSTK